MKGLLVLSQQFVRCFPKADDVGVEDVTALKEVAGTATDEAEEAGIGRSQRSGLVPFDLVELVG